MLTLGIFAVQLLLFGAAALYLHYLSEHFGIAALLFFVAGIMGVLNIIELVALFVKVSPDLVIRPAGHVYIPIILLIILIVYVTSGTRAARIMIGGLIGIDVLILVVLAFLSLYLHLYDPTTVFGGFLADTSVLTPQFFRGVVASTIAFMANTLVIIVVFQGVRNSFPAFPESLVPGLALILALWVDAIVYNVLAFLGTPNFATGIPSDILAKTLAGLVLTPMLGWYLTRVAPKSAHYRGATDRATFDIVLGDDRQASRLDQLEEELQVSRATYEQLMLHIEEVFWLVDVSERSLLYLSPNFEKLTGRPSEVFYKDADALVNLIHPEDVTPDFFDKVFLAPCAEFRIVQEDGSIRWLRNQSFPIVTQDQRIIRYAGIAEDITIRKEAEAQAFALELSREKEKLLHRFVRDASHDLRTPLTTILLKIGMFEKADSARRVTLQDELRGAVTHLDSLIEDMFSLSYIESSDVKPMELVDFNQIIEQVVKSQQAVAESKNLKMTMRFATEALPITGSDDQLFRLVANLVSNAIQYTNQGSVEVATFIEDDKAVLTVSDTGIGISEADTEKIFDRFYRSDEARAMRYQGTGLGLAISQIVVERHGGEIVVKSEVGQGTTFKVVLPLKQSAAAT